MSKQYDDFKEETIRVSEIVRQALGMHLVDDEFADGFNKAMWEAREIFMRLEDMWEQAEKENSNE